MEPNHSQFHTNELRNAPPVQIFETYSSNTRSDYSSISESVEDSQSNTEIQNPLNQPEEERTFPTKTSYRVNLKIHIVVQ